MHRLAYSVDALLGKAPLQLEFKMHPRLFALKGEAGAVIDAMAAVTVADTFDPQEFASLETRLSGIHNNIKALEKATALQASLAVPTHPADGGKTVPATARRHYGGLRAFKGVGAEERAYRVGQWALATLLGNSASAEWCRENGVTITRAQAEGVNNTGGFLVPEEMMGSIIDLREQYGVFRQEAQIVPMARDTMNWPRRTSGLTAYFVGENTAPTESQAGWDSVNLTAKKLATLTRFSTEIAEDAVINIADWLTNEIAYAFATKEDDCGFNGDGTSTYGGMRGLTFLATLAGTAGSKFTAAAGHNTFALLDNTDLTGLMGTLPFYAVPGAKFYCSQLAFATCFERLIATAGGNTVNTLDGSIVYRYLGFPIVIAQKLPAISTTLTTKAMLFFGNLKLAAAMGVRREVTLMRSEHRYMDQDQIGLIGTERFDINNHDVGTATAAGPLVALVAP